MNNQNHFLTSNNQPFNLQTIMSATKQSVRTELTEKISKCKRISVNGVAYFGEVAGDKVKTISNAVPEKSSMTETALAWVKAHNLSNLTSLTISGDATYVEQPLTEDQQQEVELVVIRAARAAANALPELINSKI